MPFCKLYLYQSIINYYATKMKKVNQILDLITTTPLTEPQKELIIYRKKLLDHLDKLKTYEILLNSSSKFDKSFYEEFRSLSPVENAVK